MSEVLLVALAVACILTALEGLVFSMGKWRGLIAITISLIFLIMLGDIWPHIFVDTLAATFVGLTASLFVEQAFSQDVRTLPRRVASRDLPK